MDFNNMVKVQGLGEEELTNFMRQFDDFSDMVAY